MSVAPTPVSQRTPDSHRLRVGALVALATLIATIALVIVFRDDLRNSSSIADGVQGSGVPATQARHVGAFDGVELAGSNNVTVVVGDNQSVLVHADDNLISHVTTQVRDHSLVVGNTSGSFTATSRMYVDVHVPSLTALRLSGSGMLSATGIQASALTISLDGTGLLNASGAATRLDVMLAGSGDGQLRQLPAQDVRAEISGSGRLLVTATRRLDASIPGSGEIVYAGDPPTVTTSVTGSGAVVHG